MLCHTGRQFWLAALYYCMANKLTQLTKGNWQVISACLIVRTFDPKVCNIRCRMHFFKFPLMWTTTIEQHSGWDVVNQHLIISIPVAQSSDLAIIPRPKYSKSGNIREQ